jgi:hypothetical protein
MWCESIAHVLCFNYNFEYYTTLLQYYFLKIYNLFYINPNDDPKPYKL